MLLTDLIQFIKTTHIETKKRVFPWNDEGLTQYLAWAFSKDYLFVESDENGLTGCLVAYPLPISSDGTIQSLLPSDNDVSKQFEADNELVIMDGIFKTSKARKTITQKFMKRFPNWKNQKKWATRKVKPTVLSNRYIELTGALN
ncbi:hypothetical protein CCP3SC1AL1_400014 [Gammaproteobacteria bacterium]